MNRIDALRSLAEISEAVTEGLVVFDNGCEFRILTCDKGFACTVGGAFPIIGPVRLSAVQHAHLTKMFDRKGDDIGQMATGAVNDESLLEIADYLGEDAIRWALCWPAHSELYVFHDIGRCASAAFLTLEAAYAHCVSYFTETERGVLWNTLTDADLVEWCGLLNSWREHGSQRLPRTEWLGAYYSPSGAIAQIRVP